MDPQPIPALSDFPIIIALPVQWGDQDAFGHVNNTVYLRWFESARIAYFDRVGVSALMAAEGVGPILASITCQFRRPITYPATVAVGARVSRIGRTSLTMDHRLDLAPTQEPGAEGTSTIVMLDYRTNRPTPVPEPLRRAIAALEGKPL
jgi:acyl-CoA thioester hydrolase